MTKTNPVAEGYQYAFPGNTQFTFSEGMDLFTWLLGHALAGAMATGTTPIIAADMAASAADAALRIIAKHHDGEAYATE